MLPYFLAAQEESSFDNRLEKIEKELEYLSDSVMQGLNEQIDLSVSGMPIQAFLRTVAEAHSLNVQIDPTLSILLTNNFTRVRVIDLFIFICREYQLDIHIVGNILSFRKYLPPRQIIPLVGPKKLDIEFNPAAQTLSMDLNEDSLKTVVKKITMQSNRNVMYGGFNLSGKLINGLVKDLPFESALDKIAYVNDLRINKTKDGVYIFEGTQSSNQIGQPIIAGSIGQISKMSSQSEIQVKDSLIDIDVINYPIIEIIQEISSRLGKNYILFSELTGNTSAHVKGVEFDDVLSFLFQGTSFTFKKNENIYLIGQRNQEGFRMTEVVKLNFRTVDGIEKEIPTDMSKDMEIKVVKELNSLIITGNKSKINDIISFLKVVDQPIPNILIEVILADASKGFSLETGLKAILSDSVPKTAGQIFPGLDLNISSPSINRTLQNLGGNGIINLGRVSPRFYINLKALEENNDIQIRSTPKLSTLNGSKATLVIGESVYYVEQTQNITGGVNPITTTAQRFNKVEANLSITISPMVSGSEHITLDIVAEFSSFVAPNIVNAPPGNATRKFESKIRIKNDEMIILGGLEEVSKSQTGSGIPLLSRIPILKWFFSSKSKKSSEKKLIVFIKPTLVY
jgi:type IV pilus assembly protein PilQ